MRNGSKYTPASSRRLNILDQEQGSLSIGHTAVDDAVASGEALSNLDVRRSREEEARRVQLEDASSRAPYVQQVPEPGTRTTNCTIRRPPTPTTVGGVHGQHAAEVRQVDETMAPPPSLSPVTPSPVAVGAVPTEQMNIGSSPGNDGTLSLSHCRTAANDYGSPRPEERRRRGDRVQDVSSVALLPSIGVACGHAAAVERVTAYTAMEPDVVNAGASGVHGADPGSGARATPESTMRAELRAGEGGPTAAERPEFPSRPLPPVTLEGAQPRDTVFGEFRRMVAAQQHSGPPGSVQACGAREQSPSGDRRSDSASTSSDRRLGAADGSRFDAETSVPLSRTRRWVPGIARGAGDPAGRIVRRPLPATLRMPVAVPRDHVSADTSRTVRTERSQATSAAASNTRRPERPEQSLDAARGFPGVADATARLVEALDRAKIAVRPGAVSHRDRGTVLSASTSPANGPNAPPVSGSGSRLVGTESMPQADAESKPLARAATAMPSRAAGRCAPRQTPDHPMAPGNADAWLGSGRRVAGSHVCPECNHAFNQSSDLKVSACKSRECVARQNLFGEESRTPRLERTARKVEGVSARRCPARRAHWRAACRVRLRSQGTCADKRGRAREAGVGRAWLRLPAVGDRRSRVLVTNWRTRLRAGGPLMSQISRLGDRGRKRQPCDMAAE